VSINKFILTNDKAETVENDLAENIIKYLNLVMANFDEDSNK